MRAYCALMMLSAAVGHSAAQVEIPDGFEIIEIDTSDYSPGTPTINNCGVIIFDKQLGSDFEDKEVFLYDNGKITRLTNDNVSDRHANINDSGTVIWLRNAVRYDKQIALYRDGEFLIFAESPKGYYSAALGNGGQIAFAELIHRGCPNDVRILFWDGETVRRISPKDGLTNQAADLNDAGDVVWMHTDFCVNPWRGDIQFWSGPRPLTLPSQFNQVQVPTINNIGQIAWDSEGGIELWEDGQTVLLTDSGGVPELNDHGDIAFWRLDEVRNDVDKWVYQNRDGRDRFYRLTDWGHHTGGDINNWGEVVWRYFERAGVLSGGWLFLRRIRTGDAQFDGSIDLSDFAALAGCLTGPARLDGVCKCRFLDIDYDGDVDLGDFAQFQNVFDTP